MLRKEGSRGLKAERSWKALTSWVRVSGQSVYRDVRGGRGTQGTVSRSVPLNTDSCRSVFVTTTPRGQIIQWLMRMLMSAFRLLHNFAWLETFGWHACDSLEYHLHTPHPCYIQSRTKILREIVILIYRNSPQPEIML